MVDKLKVLYRKVRRFIQKRLLRKLSFKARTGFYAQRYQMHNQRRQEHLASLNLPIAGKSVLEVGAGVGDHTHFFIQRGCNIELTEARRKNVKEFKKRFPGIQIYEHDMDNPYKNDWSKTYDIVYAYGLLYHLKDPEQAIKFMSEKTKDMLLLETVVSYGNDESINNVEEPSAAESQSFVGIGCRPTRPWVFKTLKKHFPHVYVTKTQPNHEQFPTDWNQKPEGKMLSRSVFVASRKPIENNLLSSELLMKQTKGY